jgi:hypothetical protein
VISLNLVLAGLRLEPQSMTASNGSKTSWQSSQIKVIKSDYLQFVISANESLFYAEVPTVFIYKEPLFHQAECVAAFVVFFYAQF